MMKKVLHAWVALVLLWGAGGVLAQDISVKVAPDRTAAVTVLDTEPNPDVSGTVKGAADLKSGKAGLRADLTIKDASEIQGAQADIFAKMTGQTIEAIGFLEAKIPANSPDAPTVLDVGVESVTKDDSSTAHFDVNLEAPADTSEVPSGSGKAFMKGNFKAFTSGASFDLSGGGIKGSEIPFQQLKIGISEKENKTTISFSMTVAENSPMTAQLQSLPTLAPMLEGQLKSSQIKYENIKFPAPKVEGGKMLATAEITLIDLRETLKPYWPMVAAQLQGGPEVQKGLEEMAGAKLDNFEILVDVADAALKGNVALNVSALNHFWNGYLAILPELQAAAERESVQGAGANAKFVEAILKLNAQQAAANLKLLADSAMELDGEATFKLDVSEAKSDAKDTAKDASKDTKPLKGILKLVASGKMMANHYDAYVAKAKEAGLPVAESAVGKLTLNLKDQTTLTGNAYLYTDGNIVNYYKGMLAQAAKDGKATEDVQKAIADLQLNEIAAKVNLKDNKVAIEAKGDTSDLSKIASLVLTQVAPGFQADLLGGSVDAAWDGTTNKVDSKINFANFLPGKDAAAIKEALGLPEGAKVALDAAAADVAMAEVDMPTLMVDGKLAEVQTDGQKLLAASPVEVATGTTTEGGGKKTGLIAVGALLLLGVGGFLAFGSKKST